MIVVKITRKQDLQSMVKATLTETVERSHQEGNWWLGTFQTLTHSRTGRVGEGRNRKNDHTRSSVIPPIFCGGWAR